MMFELPSNATPSMVLALESFLALSTFFVDSSTKALLAASVEAVGAATLCILLLLAVMVPVPEFRFTAPVELRLTTPFPASTD